MRAELQRHLVKSNINIRMVVGILSFFGDLIDKLDAFQESIKLECPAKGLIVLRPARDFFKEEIELFGGEGWHGGMKSTLRDEKEGHPLVRWIATLNSILQLTQDLVLTNADLLAFGVWFASQHAVGRYGYHRLPYGIAGTNTSFQ